MAKIGTIFNQEIKKSELHPKRITRWIHYTKLKDNKAQYRNGRTEDEKAHVRERVEALADLIEADGEVLQELLVRKIDTDEYEIIAGHHRRNACRILAEERGKEQFALLPCIIRNVSDVRAEFSLYSTNGYGNKSDYEIMCELEGMKHLLETYPEEFPELQTGRMVERLAKQTGMKRTTVGEYLTIAKNLSEQGMNAFEAGELKKSAAVELAALPEEEQDELLEKELTSYTEIREYKQQKKEMQGCAAEPDRMEIPGQLRIPEDYPEAAPEAEDPNVPESGTAEADPFVPKSDTEINPDVPKSGTKSKPALPLMKKREEYAAFLKNYWRWPVWCRNELTEETFYRHELPDGGAVVVRVFPITGFCGKEKIEYQTYYLIEKDTRYFHDGKSNMTDVIEHLKKLQKAQ